MADKPHRCDATKLDGRYLGSALYGSAITECLEDNAGVFWVHNEEYMSQVFYCPVCGAKASVAKATENEPALPKGWLYGGD